MSTLSQKQPVLLQTHNGPAPAPDMAYQKLYTNIALSWRKEQQQHTILLTTPSPYPAQDLVAINTAIAAAQNGTTTILVDADLHTPASQRFFGSPGPGLSDLLASQELTPQTIAPYLSTTATPNLQLLSAGQKQPSLEEVGRFFTTNLAALLDGLRRLSQETARGPALIMVHCPPVLASIEAALISSQVEQTFLVIVAGNTKRTHARKAQEQLQRAHAHIEGMILLNG